MKLKIETNFFPLISANTRLPEGIEIDKNHSVANRGDELSSIIFNIVGSISASLVAAWIYEKLSKFRHENRTVLKINNRHVKKITKDEILEIIEQEFEVKK